MTLPTARPRLGALLVGTAILLLLFPAVVGAHAEIESATPQDGSTVTGPVTEISATYTEALKADSSLKITNVDGATVATGSVDPSDDRRMTATPNQPLEAGTFTVASTAIATDGHIEKQKWTFTVEAPATPTPTPAVTDQPTAAPTSSPEQSPSPTSVPTPAASSDGGSPTVSTGDAILPIIAALAIVAAGGLLLGRRGRRGPAG